MTSEDAAAIPPSGRPDGDRTPAARVTTGDKVDFSSALPSLDSVMGAALDRIPDALASSEARSRARALARRLPPATALLAELRFGDPDGCVDLSIRIDERDDTLAIVEGRHPTIHVAPSLAADPAWRRAATFCAEWRRPNGPLHRTVETAWFEFDGRDANDERTPKPLMFFSHHRDRRRSAVHARLARIDGVTVLAEPFRWVIDPALSLLIGQEEAAALWPDLRPWLRDPDRALLRHVGVMWARDERRLRLCLTVPIPALSAVLAENAGAADAQSLADLVRSVAEDDCATTVLHVDVGQPLGPDLGFELKPGRPAAWPLVLDRMTALGLCGGRQAGALLDWARSGDDPRGLPGWTSRVGATLAARDRAGTLRAINHVKISRGEGGRLEAKAYLATRRIAPSVVRP